MRILFVCPSGFLRIWFPNLMLLRAMGPLKWIDEHRSPTALKRICDVGDVTYQWDKDFLVLPFWLCLQDSNSCPLAFQPKAMLPSQAGILRPGFYEAPAFGRDDAPLRLNVLSFYFRSWAAVSLSGGMRFGLWVDSV